MTAQITVTREPARRRYEATDDDGLAGFVDYQETDELVVVTHTEVDRAHEGRGVGSALARAVMEDVRARGLRALVICPFVSGWLSRHPEHRDLLYNAPPSAATD